MAEREVIDSEASLDARTPDSSVEAAPSATKRWLGTIPFILTHVIAVVGGIVYGVTLESVIMCVALIVIRTWGITAGYHRYFSHRTFKTSRVFQFFLAFLAETSIQKGVLWWASNHRVHHKLSDQPGDVHSPVQKGFLYSHMGWLFDDTEETRWDRIQDFAKYPELRFLNEHWLLPPVMMGAVCLYIGGLPGLFIGFLLSSVLLWHNTFLVNSLAHVVGKKRFDSGDESRNNLFIAVTTLGEGWHNNHHYYQSSCRQGFYWWEIDFTYYGIKLLSYLGIVWDVREPPERVLEEGRRRDREARALASARPVAPAESQAR